jgi:hypothetical protein
MEGNSRRIRPGDAYLDPDDCIHRLRIHTPSTVYSQEMETYLILERFNPNLVVAQLGPAIGGEDIDYKRIAKIVNLLFEKRTKEILETLNKTGK